MENKNNEILELLNSAKPSSTDYLPPEIKKLSTIYEVKGGKAYLGMSEGACKCPVS